MKAKIKAAKLPKARAGQANRKTDSTQQKETKGTKPGIAASNGEMEVKYVLRKDVRPDANQPRKTFDEGKLKELAESITAVGIRQPIQVEWVTGCRLMEPDLISKEWSVVKAETPNTKHQAPEKHQTSSSKESWCLGNFKTEEKAREFMAARPGGYYRIVDGERRWRAAELAKVERVPVMVVDTSAPDWEKRKLAIQVVLNQQHENLTALEEAAAYAKEIEEGRHTAESLYKTMGISRGSLFQRLALNRLEPAAREALLAGRISVSVAGLLNAVRKEELPNAISRIAGRPFREAQKTIEEYFARQLKDAAFDQEQPYALAGAMVPASEPDAAGMSAGCKGCGYRSGNLEGSGLKNPNVCTLPACFEAKTKAAADLKLAAAREKGHQVVSETTAKTLFHDYGDCGVRSSSGYVDLDAKIDPCGNLKKTWREALKEGAEELPVSAAVDPAGQVRELVKEVDAKTLAKKLGVKVEGSYGGGMSESYKAEQKKRQAEEKARKYEEWKISEAIVAKVEGLKGFDVEWIWNVLAQALMDLGGFYVMQPIEKRRGWASEKGKFHGDMHEEQFAKMTVAQRIGLALEIATSRDEDLQNLVGKELKVDITGIGKQAREEWKANGGKAPKAAAETKAGDKAEDKGKGKK